MSEKTIEEKQETKTTNESSEKTTVDSAPVASFTDLLSGKLPENPKPEDGEPPKEDPPSEKDKEEPEEKPEEKEPEIADKPEPEQKDNEDVALLNRQNVGLRNEIQRLRQKLRDQKQEVEDAEYNEPEETPERKTETEHYATKRELYNSQKNAERNHEDFGDAYKAFESVLIDKESGTILDESLYKAVLTAIDPGEFAYQEGKKILLSKKYGSSNPEVIEKKMKDEMKAQIEKELRAELEKEFQEKLKKRNQTPTDISGARAASGDVEPEYRPLSFGGALQNLRKGTK